MCLPREFEMRRNEPVGWTGDWALRETGRGCFVKKATGRALKTEKRERGSLGGQEGARAGPLCWTWVWPERER